MSSTNFIDKQTLIEASWLNDVNNKTYADPQIDVLAASSGSSLVGYISAESGAVATTVQAELRDITDRKQINARLMGVAVKALEVGTAKIVCVGDSITYGQDTVSGGVIAPVPPHTATRVPTPYPSKLQTRLNTIYTTSGITVENRGYSGDDVVECYARWTTNPTAQLAFIMLGLNDASGVLSLTTYTQYMALLIERYQDWGCAVVVMTATSVNQGAAFAYVEAYRTAARMVAEQYGCPVLEANKTGLHNVYTAIYSDGVHFNEAGYGLLGNTVANFIAAGGLQGSYYTISSKDTLLCGQETNVITNGSFSQGSGAYVNQELILTLAKGTTQIATYGFYLEAEAAYINLIGLLGLTTTVSIDGDSIRAVATSDEINATASSSRTTIRDSLRTHPNNVLNLGKVIGRGWHSVTIGAPVIGSTLPTYISALEIAPCQEIDCSDDVYFLHKRTFSVYDPAITFHSLPAASSVTTITVPAYLFAALIPTNNGFNYYHSAHAIVTLRGVGANVSCTQYMLTAVAAGYSVVLLSSVGANPVTITAVTGPAHEQVAGDFVFTLARPAANYLEMRFDVVDAPSLRNAAIL